MSILDPMACGFAKVAVYNIISVTPKKLPNERETVGEYSRNFEVTNNFLIVPKKQ